MLLLKLFHSLKSAFITLILLGISLTANADSITGRIVGISDGDTLTLLDESNTQHKIRLAAIDAPERAQPFGNRSKQQLSTLCFKQPVIVEVVDKDRYGRSVGVVTCNGVNANEAMLTSGMAWVYVQYAKGFEYYDALEHEAQANQVGLWVEPNPIPPWEWRKARRNE